MDWSSSKGPSWDWPELDQQQSFPSNNNNNNNNDGSDVDLKLGSVTIATRAQLGSSSSVSNLPSKRARAAANSNSSTQTAAYYCLVDGCTSDLSNCRDYHRRHKVCEVHSKTPEVTIQGRKQRFCQQCSRFHALDEFDEGKRSCRKRLDGHNRRRRKPQPETHLQQGTYLPNFPGAGMLSFSNSPCHTHTKASLVSPNSWPCSVTSVNKLEVEDHYNTQPHLNLLEKQIPFTDYSSSRLREAKQLTFSQGEHQTIQQAPSQSLDHKVFYDGLANTQAPDSDCALSLLSRPLLPMHVTPTDISFRTAIPMRPGEPSNHFSTQQPTAPCPEISFHNVFQTGPDVANEPQTLPFYWE